MNGLPQKLQAQVEFLLSSPRMSFVACASNVIAQNGADLGDLYRGHPVVVWIGKLASTAGYNFIATPSVLAWKRNIAAVGGFDENLKIGEDQDLWIKLALFGDLGYVPQSWCRVHSRENSLSAEEFSDQLTYTLPMIERHVSALRRRLSNAEVRQIWGKRLGRVGRVAYVRGDYRTGLATNWPLNGSGLSATGNLHYIAVGLAAGSVA